MYGIKSLYGNILDYRGEIIVALHNDSDNSKTIHKGDRIAQLVIQPYMPVVLQEVSDLSETKRGEGGFGSTGTRSTAETTESYDYEQITLKEILKN